MHKLFFTLSWLLCSINVQAWTLVEFHHDARAHPDHPSIQMVYVAPDLPLEQRPTYEEDLQQFYQQMQPYFSSKTWDEASNEIRQSWFYLSNSSGATRITGQPATLDLVVYRHHFNLSVDDPGMMAVLQACDHPRDLVRWYGIFQRYLMLHELRHTSQRVDSQGDLLAEQADENDADREAYAQLLQLASTPQRKHDVRRWFRYMTEARLSLAVLDGFLISNNWRDYHRMIIGLPQANPSTYHFRSPEYQRIAARQFPKPREAYPHSLFHFRTQYNQTYPQPYQDWLPTGDEAVIGHILRHTYQDKLQRWERQYGPRWWESYLAQATVVPSSPFHIPEL